MESKKFKTVISSKRKVFDLHVKETFKYRDLIFLFVKRDFTALYKQTILGPAWAVLQPLFTTFVFTFIFGTLANLTTADTPELFSIPGFLFYMSGTILFQYFTTNVSATSKTFIANSHTMGKVYYPRLVQPIATSITNLISFGIQLVLFIIVWLVFLLSGTTEMVVTPWMAMLPLIILEMMVLSTGLGMVISALTTKYRDLQMVVGFGLQLWQYLTPVPYGLALISESPTFKDMLPAYMCVNPMADIVCTFRLAMFGHGYFNIVFYLASWGVSIALFFLGLMLFSKTEKNFMDTI